ncbi:924_t:CDS:2 [Dentiscutata heterogama]|uniref:924_t:CDS:1 n=1 Tax=Dentiscutata heterogama TaxID=1316150 RepID=A0ACA9L2X3_9GLOM|nr:924_t:CDS:2 [Dentiscutata heterogama]
MILDVIPPINSRVNSSTTNISIRFISTVYLSTGIITIYEASNHRIRQRVSATSKFCKLSNDGMVVNISIIDSTFNEGGKKYYVKMDNNFAKSRKFNNEPLKGIESEIWILESESRVKRLDKDIIGLIQLAPDASEKFLKFSKTGQSNYFDDLKQEFINKVPVQNSNLTLGPIFEIVNKSVVIQLRIDGNAVSDLNNMIKYKNITTFSSGLTNDLDQNFGFQKITDPWNGYGIQIVAVIVTYIILYLLSRILSYKGIKNPFFGDKFIKWVMKYPSLVVMLIILASTDYEYLTILKDGPMLTKKYEQIKIFNLFIHISEAAIIWGAFFDIFFRTIP